MVKDAAEDNLTEEKYRKEDAKDDIRNEKWVKAERSNGIDSQRDIHENDILIA